MNKNKRRKQEDIRAFTNWHEQTKQPETETWNQQGTNKTISNKNNLIPGV